MKVIEYGRAMGLDMIQGDHEDAPGQLELNFTFDDALATCDRLTTYRQICAQVAREHDLIACFMCKPLHGRLCIGLPPQSLAMARGRGRAEAAGERVASRHGGRLHASGRRREYVRSPSGKAGAGSHGPAVHRRRNRTSARAHSHRMFHGEFVPAVVGDGVLGARLLRLGVSEPDLRAPGLGPGRFEYRAVDAMVNPYLMAGALLKAFDDGIRRDLDPGEPEHRNIYEAIEEGKEVTKLPTTLGDALDKLEQDEVIRSSLPGEMYDVYMHYKRDEWERFLATVTDWDLETYWDCLP